MTSNKPSMLDKALTRPGRIDKTLHLDYVSAGQAEAMVRHYFKGFEEISGHQVDQLHAILTNPRGEGKPPCFSPAEVEQLCAEYESIDNFLIALDEKAQEVTRIHANIPGTRRVVVTSLSPRSKDVDGTAKEE
jgi:SpoVK/Ycf46/Vps4 family AAA+-type ATPase